MDKTSVTRKIPKWAASPQTWQRVEKGRTYHWRVSLLTLKNWFTKFLV